MGICKPAAGVKVAIRTVPGWGLGFFADEEGTPALVDVGHGTVLSVHTPRKMSEDGKAIPAGRHHVEFKFDALVWDVPGRPELPLSKMEGTVAEIIAIPN